MYCHSNRLLVGLSVALLTTNLILGCGGSNGGGSSTKRGRVTLTVTWPTSRAIPAATRSIKVLAKVLQPANGPQVGLKIVERPVDTATTTIVLDALPSVKVRLTATAYASTNGTGEVLAQGSTEIQVLENDTVNGEITLADGGGCKDPKAGAFVSAGNDDGSGDAFNLGAFAANSSSTGVRHFTIDNQPFDVSTAASASVDRGQLAASASNFGQGTARFEDELTITAPGKEGQTGQMTVVMNATAASNGGADRNIRYLYRVEGFVSGDIDIEGAFYRGTPEGDAPASGQVSSVVSFVYGEPIRLLIELSLDLSLYDATRFQTQSISWSFVRFQGLPTGATVTSASCDPWPSGG